MWERVVGRTLLDSLDWGLRLVVGLVGGLGSE